MSDEENFREQFIASNANLEFIAHQFADVVRNLMRASVANDPSATVYRASEQMNFVADLLSRTKEKFGFYHVFEKAIADLQIEEERSEVDGAIVEAARSGVKFLVERSCSDNAARGRSSKRQQEFMKAIQWIEEAREENRRKWDRSK